MLLRRVFIVIFFSFSSVSILQDAHGRARQETSGAETASQEAVAAAPEPVAIPASLIVTKEAQLDAELQRVRGQLTPLTAVEGIDASLPEVAAVIADLRTDLDKIDANRVSFRKLEDERQRWNIQSEKLQKWLSQLDERWQYLQKIRDEVKRRQTIWQLTRQSAMDEEYPPELLQQIEQIAEKLIPFEAQARERSDVLARVINGVAEQNKIVRESLEEIDQIAVKARGRIWTRTAPPLWELGETYQQRSLTDDISKARSYWLSTTMAFFENRLGSVLFHLLVLAVLLVLTLALRRLGRPMDGDEENASRGRLVVSRPFSAALAFSIAMMPSIYGEVPGPIDDLMGFLILIPLLRLGVIVYDPLEKPLLYNLVALFVFHQIWQICPDGTLLQRLMLLILSAVALVVMVRMIRRLRLIIAQKPLRRWRLAFVGLLLAVVLLAVALPSNVLGWLTLAHVLTSGAIISAVGAVAWMVVVRSIIAIVPFFAGSAVGQKLYSVKNYRSRLQRWVVFIVVIVATYDWCWSVLARFRLSEVLQSQANNVISTDITWGNLNLSLGGVLIALIIVASTFVVARVIRFVLVEEVIPRLRLPPGADNTLTTLTNYLVLILGVLLAAGAIGFSATQVTVVFGALGVGIGFGLQSVVNNFISGLILIFERPIKVGDRIEAAGYLGIVKRIGIRASVIRAFNGAEVVVPNGDLISKEVVNWTLSDRIRRVDIPVRVAIGSDPRQVQEILKKIAAGNPAVLPEPGPNVVMTRFGESSLDFELRSWAMVEDAFASSSEMHIMAKIELERAGIKVAVPRRELQVTSGAPQPQVIDGASSNDSGNPADEKN